MFTSCSFDEKENQFNYYRGKYCIEKLCKKLKTCTMKIINYEKKEMIQLTKQEKMPYKNNKHAIYVKKGFNMIKVMKIIKIKERLKITVITQENLE